MFRDARRWIAVVFPETLPGEPVGAGRARFVDRLFQNPDQGPQKVDPPTPKSTNRRRMSPESCKKSGGLRKIPPDFLRMRPHKHKTRVRMRGKSTGVLILSGDMRGLWTDIALHQPTCEESDPGSCVSGPTSGACEPTFAECGSTSRACGPEFCACRPMCCLGRSGICAGGHTSRPDGVAYGACQARIAEVAPHPVPTQP
jgi:hypothetical protein